MTKYKVTLHLIESKVAEFVVEAKDSDELHNLLGEIDIDFIKENAGFYSEGYEVPTIEKWEKVNKNTPIHKEIQKEMNLVKKAWEAL